jgi:hypothetical protein
MGSTRRRTVSERGAGVPGPELWRRLPLTDVTDSEVCLGACLGVVFGLRLETVHPSVVHLEKFDSPMPSSEKSSTSKVLHVFEGHPSFYCSNCSAVIASISHFTSPDYI